MGPKCAIAKASLSAWPEAAETEHKMEGVRNNINANNLTWCLCHYTQSILLLQLETDLDFITAVRSDL